MVMNALLVLPGYEFRLLVLRTLGGWQIGRDTSIGRGCRITCRGRVRIGEVCNINQNVVVDGRGGVVIGDHVEIANGVRILSAGHDVRSVDFAYVKSRVEIGSRTWLATEAMVLLGVTMGSGSAAAARAVVTNSVPDGAIVGGVPARTIGTRPADAQTVHSRYRRFAH